MDAGDSPILENPHRKVPRHPQGNLRTEWKTLSQKYPFWVIPKWLIITLSVLLFFIVSLVIFLFFIRKSEEIAARLEQPISKKSASTGISLSTNFSPTPTTASFGTPFPPQITPPQKAPSPTPVTRMTAPAAAPPTQRTSDTLPSPRPKSPKSGSVRLPRATNANSQPRNDCVFSTPTRYPAARIHFVIYWSGATPVAS